MANEFYTLRRYTPLRPRRWKPRPGVVADPAYRRWLHTQPCIVHGRKCGWYVEMHHVGRLRNDRRGVPLCPGLHRGGPNAVHTIGRRAFEERFNVSFEAAIIGLNDEYELEQGRRGSGKEPTGSVPEDAIKVVNF